MYRRVIYVHSQIQNFEDLTNRTLLTNLNLQNCSAMLTNSLYSTICSQKYSLKVAKFLMISKILYPKNKSHYSISTVKNGCCNP